MRTTLLGLLISLVCAAAAGALAWRVTAPDLAPEAEGVTERAAAAADSFRDSHVHVEPDVRGIFSERQVARLEEAAAASDPPVFLVIWRQSYQAGYFSSADVLNRIARRLDRPGVYVEVTPGSGISGRDVGIEGTYVSFSETMDGEWSSQQVTDTLLARIRENDERDHQVVGFSSADHFWGGTGSTIAAGLLLGSLGGLVGGLVGMVTWTVVRRRRAAVWQEGTTT